MRIATRAETRDANNFESTRARTGLMRIAVQENRRLGEQLAGTIRRAAASANDGDSWDCALSCSRGTEADSDVRRAESPGNKVC